MRFFKCLLLLLPLLANAQSAKPCDWLPEERSAADIPVEVGFTNFPGQSSLVAVVVNYGTLMERPLPRDANDPRLHTHIWIMDKSQCKKLVALPLPINATINVDGIKTDSNALPLKIVNGNYELKYAFAIPEKIHTIIARKVIIDKQWKIQSTEDVEVQLKGDARKAAFIADWHGNGHILHVTEPLSNNYHVNSLVHFESNVIKLFRFISTHPEFQFMKDGVVMDDSKSINKKTFYPRYYLMTSFDLEFKYFRQYALPQIQKSSRQLQVIYFNETKDYSIIKISNMQSTISGRIIEPKNLSGKILPDYNGDDKLKSADIASFVWQNGQWVNAPQLQPVVITAEDLKKTKQVWP